jgi:hypothetical protein
MTAARDDEIERRVALLRRFRELLAEQRGKFERYLEVLDHERSDIESGDVDRLVAHVEIEEQIVSEIYTFQKAIDPLDELYRAAFAAAPGGAAAGANEPDVHALKGTLDELRGEVLRRSKENRALLGKRMEVLRREIAGLRNPLASRKSVYAASGEGGLVDISG